MFRDPLVRNVGHLPRLDPVPAPAECGGGDPIMAGCFVDPPTFPQELEGLLDHFLGIKDRHRVCLLLGIMVVQEI